MKGGSAVLVRDIMTSDVEAVSPDDKLEKAAWKMEQLTVGPLPVLEGRSVVGMLTDREITVRATAAGCDPRTTLVGDAMSLEVVSCFEDRTSARRPGS
jgi:CBS domain-containing protein